MTDISKGNRKHMTLSDRIIIEQGLNQQMTFKSIAASIEKDPSSISKEIRRYLLWSGEDPVPYRGNDCVHYKTCTIDMLCMWDCSGYCKDCNRKGCNYYCHLFESASCGRLDSAPYVCNGCPAVGSCHKTHRFYSAEKAQQRYSELLVSSRSGINISPEDLCKGVRPFYICQRTAPSPYLTGLSSSLFASCSLLLLIISSIASLSSGRFPCITTMFDGWSPKK